MITKGVCMGFALNMPRGYKVGKAPLGLSDCRKGPDGEGEGAVRTPGMKASFVWEIQEQLLEGIICRTALYRSRYFQFVHMIALDFVTLASSSLFYTQPIYLILKLQHGYLHKTSIERNACIWKFKNSAEMRKSFKPTLCNHFYILAFFKP